MHFRGISTFTLIVVKTEQVIHYTAHGYGCYDLQLVISMKPFNSVKKPGREEDTNIYIYRPYLFNVLRFSELNQLGRIVYPVLQRKERMEK